jgi:hypothetical protein
VTARRKVSEQLMVQEKRLEAVLGGLEGERRTFRRFCTCIFPPHGSSLESLATHILPIVTHRFQDASENARTTGYERAPHVAIIQSLRVAVFSLRTPSRSLPLPQRQRAEPPSLSARKLVTFSLSRRCHRRKQSDKSFPYRLLRLGSAGRRVQRQER